MVVPGRTGAASIIVDFQKMPLAMVYAGRFINGPYSPVGGEPHRAHCSLFGQGGSGHAWMVVDPTAACHDSSGWNGA
ncbi:hypothetical protein [Paenibacillus woosongensis]|uniref:hypothetical protein n=1 Tax=Paenibacillus woosongensis TaxID=307580 RepID=UPI0012D8729E|nr:hypothetical protein [Paenibacillus woosongensis]